MWGFAIGPERVSCTSLERRSTTPKGRVWERERERRRGAYHSGSCSGGACPALRGLELRLKVRGRVEVAALVPRAAALDEVHAHGDGAVTTVHRHVLRRVAKAALRLRALACAPLELPAHLGPRSRGERRWSPGGAAPSASKPRPPPCPMPPQLNLHIRGSFFLPLCSFLFPGKESGALASEGRRVKSAIGPCHRAIRELQYCSQVSSQCRSPTLKEENQRRATKANGTPV